MLYGSGTFPVKKDNVIRLDRNDTRMVGWMCNIRPEDTTSELRTRLKLNRMREDLQKKRLQWFTV